MTKVIAGITTSVDGYTTGPNDCPGKGLGEGGEPLHSWVFGDRWTYDAEPTGEATGDDAEWLREVMSGLGAVVGGRWTYPPATSISTSWAVPMSSGKPSPKSSSTS